MTKSNTFRKYLAIAWAIAIIWVYFGSLINFHQHQIWKKQLNPTFAAAFKREKAKTAAYTTNSDMASVPPVMVSDLPANDFNVVAIALHPLTVLHALNQDLPTLAYDPGSSSLRAPPAC